MASKLRPASSFSAFAQEAARAAWAEFLLFAPVIKRRALGATALDEPLLIDDDEEPGFPRQAVRLSSPSKPREPAVGEREPSGREPKAPRAMLAPTRSQVENGYITGQPTVKRTQKPGPKAEPKVSRRYNRKGPRR